MSPPGRVLLIGWNGADWNIILPLIEAGAMPALAKLLQCGVSSTLESIAAQPSSALWRAIATGLDNKPPERTPSFARGLRTHRSIWNILSLEALKSTIVGWPASHPADSIDGVLVSDTFALAKSPLEIPWNADADAVHPPRLCKTLSALRVHPGEIESRDMRFFVPEMERVDQGKDTRLARLATGLASFASVQTIATWLLENEPWDFAAVHYGALGTLCHAFLRYHPPTNQHVPADDCQIYGRVVRNLYCFLDMMLSRLLDLAGPETATFLVSDHGFRLGRDLPFDTPGNPLVRYRAAGILAAAGPAIKAGADIQMGTILDIAPTVLFLLGLPVGDDLKGRPLLEMLREPANVRRIPSWNSVSGNCGMHAFRP